MTKQEILDRLKKCWEECKSNERQRVEFPHTYSYNYGKMSEVVWQILHTEEVWKDDPEGT